MSFSIFVASQARKKATRKCCLNCGAYEVVTL